jgi:hypothetical protein
VLSKISKIKILNLSFFYLEQTLGFPEGPCEVGTHQGARRGRT